VRFASMAALSRASQDACRSCLCAWACLAQRQVSCPPVSATLAGGAPTWHFRHQLLRTAPCVHPSAPGVVYPISIPTGLSRLLTSSGWGERGIATACVAMAANVSSHPALPSSRRTCQIRRPPLRYCATAPRCAQRATFARGRRAAASATRAPCPRRSF
jgi:hypothetical protein